MRDSSLHKEENMAAKAVSSKSRLRRFSWLAGLMALAIVVITGFQAYWLKENYKKEKKALTDKTNQLFQQTVLQLQAANLHFDIRSWKGKNDKNELKEIEIVDNKTDRKSNDKAKDELVTTMHIVRKELKDSLKKLNPQKIIVSVDKSSYNISNDSALQKRQWKNIGLDKNNNKVVEVFYTVDSLQTPIHIEKIDSAFAQTLQKEKINIPFTVSKVDSTGQVPEEADNEISIGLLHPATFRLHLGNSFSYIIKQMTQPILFSVFLLGITLLSFVLLYKNLLRQKRLAAQKNEFISNITHELKTPIATVGVAIEALQNFNAIDNPEKTKEYLAISTNELNRLNLLVDKVLKLSMFEKNEMDMKPENVNLEKLTQEVLASLKLQLEKRNATVALQASGQSIVWGDRLHLLSVVYNLVDNAIKYCPFHPSIHINIYETDHSIVFSIKDNGIGVAPEYRKKIFEKFFRVPYGNTHNAKGYGLGLSYVARVVEQHQGTIEVKSQPGNGTTFTIHFPKTEA